MSTRPAARFATAEDAAYARRRDMVDQAATLFERGGYHQTSIADLSRAMGLAKATFYHYFESKADVLRQIHQVVLVPMAAGMTDRLPSDRPASELVRDTIVDIFSHMARFRPHLRVFFEHHRELDPEAKRSVRAARREFERGLESIIERGIASGEFMADVDPQLAALGIFGMCNWSYQWLPHDVTEVQATATGARLASLVLDGMRERQDSTPPHSAKTRGSGPRTGRKSTKGDPS